MFMGRYEHTLDAKGRLTIPSRFREELLNSGAYITLGLDRNLMVLTAPVFERVSQQVTEMNFNDPNARLLKRLLFSSAERVDVDKVGRILIPEFLRQSVGLESAAVVVGVGTYFEIWSPTQWTTQDALMQDSNENAQRFSLWNLSL